MDRLGEEQRNKSESFRAEFCQSIDQVIKAFKFFWPYFVVFLLMVNVQRHHNGFSDCPNTFAKFGTEIVPHHWNRLFPDDQSIDLKFFFQLGSTAIGIIAIAQLYFQPLVTEIEDRALIVFLVNLPCGKKFFSLGKGRQNDLCWSLNLIFMQTAVLV